MTKRPLMRRTLIAGALLLLVNVLLILATFGPSPQPAYANGPDLWLPTPVGQRWQILQGFQCGSHVGTQSRSLDLINLDGSTSGAPVRAAADGSTFVWEGSTGTLIIAHGGGYYTMYTHLRQVITTRRGLPVQRGDVIGQAGSVGTGVPHLHFTYFYAPDASAYNRTSLELNFGDGYNLTDTSGCNQHRGNILVARDEPDTIPPDVHFRSDAQPETWYCEDMRVDFDIEDDRRVEGFSQAFDRDPGGDTPEFEGDTGYVQISWEGDGTRTLYVRAWDVSGQQTLKTFGPIGYDATPPTFTDAEPLPKRTYPAGETLKLTWNAASDGTGSGIAGYKLYLGSDPQGTSDWFSDQPHVKVEGLEPGTYLLRGQALDRSCHASEWVTLQQIIISDSADSDESVPTETESAPASTPIATPEATATTAAPSATVESTATTAAPSATVEATTPVPESPESPVEATATTPPANTAKTSR